MISEASEVAGTNASGAGESVAFVLDGGREAGSAARQAVLAGDGDMPASVREDVLLLVTELVTNAVRHAGAGPEPSVRVELRRWPRRVRMEVVDAGTSFTRVPAAFRKDASGGWGLFLIDLIADRWGVTPVASGTCVWFEIRFEK